MRPSKSLVVWALLAACAGVAQAATIAVDVGHYLAAPGATSAYGESEFGYNLALAQAVAKRLRADGHVVLLIGAGGDMDNLWSRPALAAGAELFISIHHDSVNERYLSNWAVNGKTWRYSDISRGYSVFVSPDNPEYAASLACAEAVGGAMKHAGFSPNLHHVRDASGEGYTVLDSGRGVYQSSFVVVKYATIPALLLEAGVIINRDEALTMKKPETRRKIADAVASAMSCLPSA
ncbi:N-acetylmuramoyl-L-alanine amidase [Jeongeupia sp. HS-3]|uniref:N-acetylmuramoyl-L-alanine amidase family protein n=1 Tax=Jeongeupia sp. HS-3 TaxID=1009682 RepID=UPI0018A6A672|nr:N-acetylmuramoyl-L-alanine amidase [Jeongeupia sp. HS-3]BCL76102.1 N-acetylmuramoyl-L-alanine amidase [Jeongeupia sp. HS-3]